MSAAQAAIPALSLPNHLEAVEEGEWASTSISSLSETEDLSLSSSSSSSLSLEKTGVGRMGGAARNWQSAEQ